jgi:CO dehydrogenase/acetyl-CoA synthase delta subunit
MINGAEGVWHMGQRDIVWTRISNAAYARGFRLRHYGEILHAKILSSYGSIVDKVKVTLITDPVEVGRRLEIARRTYVERNRRIEAMTDESVEIFYSCLLCQSFAPNHVCVITPQRLGLCGAYNWLDGKAAFEIDPNGPNQPVSKGECLDPVKGVFKGVDDYVFLNSHKTLPSLALYSIMDKPMTSCGCFEAIVAYVPELNGVMVVNREYLGETPAGMTFSSLAGNVGGGAQTPGFMGVGKAFLTSPKFLSAEGGHRRLVWMPKSLKEMLGPDLDRLFKDRGWPELMNQIADESVGCDPKALRAHLESVKHPALAMTDMSTYIAGNKPEETPADTASPSPGKGPVPTAPQAGWTPEKILEMIQMTAAASLKEGASSEEALRRVIQTLGSRFPGASLKAGEAPKTSGPVEPALKASSILDVKTFKIPTQKCEIPIQTVKLGATRKEGGTRRAALFIGGETAMPFHSFEGAMPQRPLVAMEVFDRVSEKYPPILREIYGNLLNDPAAMAKACVEKYGADLISVRLDGTHPEKGDRTAAQAVETVKAVVAAVDVPLIVTGHNHFEKVNEVMKAVASACAGENLLLNWTEQNNYKAIAGAALAYGHTVVAQGPLDVNITKQLCILMGQMGVPTDKIVIDPMASAVGYGVEYSYSVMERIRQTALGGDQPLAQPMIVAVGQECCKVKEFKAPESDFPAWGDLAKRAAQWEIATAMSLLFAGADILALYHPEAVKAVKNAIAELM